MSKFIYVQAKHLSSSIISSTREADSVRSFAIYDNGSQKRVVIERSGWLFSRSLKCLFLYVHEQLCFSVRRSSKIDTQELAVAKNHLAREGAAGRIRHSVGSGSQSVGEFQVARFVPISLLHRSLGEELPLVSIVEDLRICKALQISRC